MLGLIAALTWGMMHGWWRHSSDQIFFFFFFFFYKLFDAAASILDPDCYQQSFVELNLTWIHHCQRQPEIPDHFRKSRSHSFLIFVLELFFTLKSTQLSNQLKENKVKWMKWWNSIFLIIKEKLLYYKLNW